MNVNEILYLLLLSFVNSLIIIGWNKATYFEWEEQKKKRNTLNFVRRIAKEKMVFWKLRFWSLKYFGDFWSKPLFTCPTCMSSFHSTYIYWPVMLLSPFSLIQIALIYPLYILMLAGVATIVNNYA